MKLEISPDPAFLSGRRKQRNVKNLSGSGEGSRVSALGQGSRSRFQLMVYVAQASGYVVPVVSSPVASRNKHVPEARRPNLSVTGKA